MKKRTSLIIGCILLAAGVCLAGYAAMVLRGQSRTEAADRAVYDSISATAEAAIPADAVGDALPLGTGSSDLSGASLLSAGADGAHSIVGTLSFPARGLTMPVGDVREDPKVLPRLLDRYSMVIEGAERSWQFDVLSKLGMSEEVVFTDVCGHRYSYMTTNIQTVPEGEPGTGDLQLMVEKSGGRRLIVSCEFVRAE